MLRYTFSAHLHTYLMLCHTPLLFACAHSWCDARQVFCTLAHILDSTLHLFCTLAHILDAMPHTLFCLLAHILDATLSRSSARLHTYLMLLYTFSARLHTYLMLCHTPLLFACTHTWCDARQVFCTLANILDATLHLFSMLAHILDASWCYATHLCCLLAHILDATLGRSSVHLHTYLMRR